MKKAIALIAAVVMMCMCLPMGALGETYVSPLLGGLKHRFPEGLTVLLEHPVADGEGLVMYQVMKDMPEAQIITTMRYVDEYVGLTTRTVDREEQQKWFNYMSEEYPYRAKGMLLRPSYGGNSRVYRFYGQNKETSTWMLSYTAVQDGLYVSTAGFAGKYGFRDEYLKAIFDAFNSMFAMYAEYKDVPFVPFDAEDFVSQSYFLSYNDLEDGFFRRT